MDVFDPIAVRRSIAFSRLVGVAAVITALIVLFGWMAGANALTRVLSGTGVMKPLSAVAFAVGGLALVLIHGSSERTRRVGRWLGAGPLLIGGLTLYEHITATNLGFDALLFHDAVVATNLPSPGRMTVAASIGFTGLGLAILLIDRRVRWLVHSQWFAIAPGLAGLVGFLGYIYGPQSLLNVPAFSSMAIHTSVLFLALSAAALFARPTVGFPAPIMSRFTGGLLARRILPLAIALPFLFGWLRLRGQEAGLYDTAFGLSVFATSNIAIFVGLIWLSAGRLNRIDVARESAAERLRASEARSRALYEHAVDLIITLDAEGTIRFANPAARQELNIAADADGMPRSSLRLESLIDEQDRGALRAAIAEALRSVHEEAVPFSVRVRRRDGDFRTLEALARNLIANVDVAAILVNARDVTEQRRLDAQRRRTEAKFLAQLRESQKMQALGTLAGGIAHDFNNILAAISGNLDLARDDLDDAHPVRRNLIEIRRATDRASDLVRRILAFARRQETVTRVIDLHGVVNEAIELLRATLPASIDLKASFDADIPTVDVDSTQIHQVLMNLGTNAAHAIGQEHGEIDVHVSATTVDGAIARTLPDLQEGRYARIAVRDSGCGIDPSIVPHIFEPFFTTKPMGRGTGLGLSVVDGIVRNHGGAISVYSELGKGTVFQVYLPAAARPAPKSADAALSPPRGANQHVLYVDDEETLVWIAQRFLAKLGYRVTSFTDSRQALQAFIGDPGRFDAVVTDLAMPGLSGPQFAERVLAIRPDLPVLMTSGYVTPEDLAEAKRLGVREVLTKPSSVEELATALDRALHEASIAARDA